MDQAFYSELFQALNQGLRMSVLLIVPAATCGLLLGILTGTLRAFGPPAIRGPANFYAAVFRGTPLVVQLFVLYFGLPNIGVYLEPYTASLVGFILCSGAYHSEYIRGGFQSIKRGQHLAAQSLGFSGPAAMLWIIVPQAVRRALPGCGNEIIYLIKYSSLAYIVTCVELTGEAKGVATLYFRFTESFLAVGAYYLALVTLATLALTPKQFRQWQKLILFIALLQLPFALYEMIFIVPERVGVVAGAELTDVIAGTFGANLDTGSANAEMATFLIIAFTFLFTRWQEKLFSGRTLLLMALLLLTPLFLGETKIVVVMLPLVTLIVLRDDIRNNPSRFVVFGTLALLLFISLGLVYVFVMDKATLHEAIQGTLAYNFQNVGYGRNVLNRTTVLTFWWQEQSLSDPLGFLLGHGLGSSYSGGGALISGHIGSLYPSYGIDLTAASTLLWDLGLVGLILYLALLAFAWFAAVRLRRGSSDPRLRADALAIQAAIALFALFTIYRNSGVSFMPWEIVQSVVLGYLGYLIKTQDAT